MTDKTEIVALPPKEQALEVFSTPKGLDPFIAKIKAEIDSFVPDVSTKKGRDAIASIAYKVAKSKTAIDNVRKDVVSDLKELPKRVDAEGKRARDLLDLWRDEVRKPLTDWEDAEAARVKKHQDGISWLNDAYDVAVNRTACDLQDMKDILASCNALPMDDSWQEFLSEASTAHRKAIDALTGAITAKEEFERQQAELERLRAAEYQRQEKEREEKRIQEAVENAKQLAEITALRESQAAAQREAQLKADLEQAERLHAEAIQAEKDRQEQELAHAEAQRIKRESDHAHKSKIEQDAIESLFHQSGLPMEIAGNIISLISQDKIQHVKIIY